MIVFSSEYEEDANALKQKGTLLEDDYPFVNQAMDRTDITQDKVNEIAFPMPRLAPVTRTIFPSSI